MSKSEAASLALTATKKTIGVGSSYDFNIKNKVKGSAYKWTSSNTKVATVNSKNGLTTAKKEGTAKISVKITLPKKAGTKTLTATVTVKKYVDATSVKISNPVDTIKLGSSHDFNRTMSPEGANNKTYWIVKDAAGKEVANTRTGAGAAIMNSKGIFKPAEAGEYTITAECWRSKTATVKRAESEALKVSVVDDIAAKAAGAKKVEVTFGASVVNTKNVVFEVKKGTSKVNVSSVEWDAANKVATLTMAGNLTDADYTVTVTGVNSTPMTASFKATAPKVTEVKIISDKAILKDVNAGKGKVTAAYKVYNQYGEDITKTTDVVITSNGGVNTSNQKGVYESTDATFDTYINKTLVLTIVHTATGANANATLPVVAEAVASSVEIVGIYNKDSKALTEGVTAANYWLEIKVKDQYGNTLKPDDAKDGLLINETNKTVATLKDVNTLDYFTAAKDRYGIQFASVLKPGTTTVLLICKANGAQAAYNINIAETTRAYEVTLDTPEFAVAGEEILVPLTVTDKEGNIITDIKVLKDKDKGINLTVANDIILKDGVTYAKINSSAEGYVTVTATSQTSYKVANVTFKVGKAARPVAIVGLDTNYKTASVGTTAELNLSDIVFEDQYGRKVTSKTANFDNMFGTAAEDVKVTVDVAGDSVFTADKTELVATDKKVTLTKKAAGSEKITLGLSVKDGTGAYNVISGSEYEFTFRFAEENEYKSYKVADLNKMFDEVGASLTNNSIYDQELKVYGILDDGKEIALADSEYEVSAPAYLNYSAGNFVLDGAAPYVDKATEVTAKVVVTINATGEQFTKEFIVSKEKPIVSEIKIVDAGVTGIDTKDAYNSAKAILETDLAASSPAKVNTKVNVLVVDNYGGVHTLLAGAANNYVGDAAFTVTPAAESMYKMDIAKNNTVDAEVTYTGEDTLTATVKVTVKGASGSFKLNVTK